MNAMANYSKDMQRYHMERVRSVMVVRPTASASEIHRLLGQSKSAPLALDYRYVLTMQKKVIGERTNRLRFSQFNLRYAEMQDKFRMIDERLWEEATSQSNPPIVRVMALKQITENELKLLEAQKDLGIFEQTPKNKTVRSLSPEQQESVLQTMKLWGLVKDDPTPPPAVALEIMAISPPQNYVEPESVPTDADVNSTVDVSDGKLGG